MTHATMITKSVLTAVIAASLSGCYIFKDDPAFVEVPPDGGEPFELTDEEVEMPLHSTLELNWKADDLLVSNGTLYAAGDGELAIYDVSTPSTPTLLSGTTQGVPDGAFGLALYENTLYIRGSRNTLEGDSITTLSIFDVSNPNVDPGYPEVFAFDIAYRQLIQKGRYIYLIEPGAIDVYDLGNEISLVQSEELTDGKFATFTIAGNQLFARWTSGDYAEIDTTNIYLIGATGMLTLLDEADILKLNDEFFGFENYLAVIHANEFILYETGSDGELTEITSADAIDWQAIFGYRNNVLNSAFIDNGIIYLSTDEGLLVFEIDGETYSFIGTSTAEEGEVFSDSTATDEVLYIYGFAELDIVQKY